MMTRLQITVWILAFASAGCGSVFGPESVATSFQTQCPSGLAQIQLADGFSRVLCGCQGVTDGQATIPPAILNCTINAGEKVWFRFEGALGSHWIVSSGTPSFPSSVVVDPEVFPVPPVHAVTFTAPGTYSFHDGITPSIQGTITVL
ncbi:MAG: hypothetical protein JNL01_09095 [Bdellovibrionales bacterium]|nr:hypothetical protein [Bdellovibrionales bacterium]